MRQGGDSALEPLSDVGGNTIYVCNLGRYFSTVHGTNPWDYKSVFSSVLSFIYTEEMLKKEMHTTVPLQQCTTQQNHSRVNPELHYITKLVEHLEVWCTCCSSRWVNPLVGDKTCYQQASRCEIALYMASTWLGKPKLVASAISPAYLAFQVNYVSNASGADCSFKRWSKGPNSLCTAC